MLSIGTNLALSPNGELHVCEEQPLVLTCEVSAQSPSPRIEWIISFGGELSESLVMQSYIPSDPVGEVQTDRRNGLTFTFNFTSYGTSALVSTLSVMVEANPSSALGPVPVIVNCGQGPSDRAVLHHLNGC